MSRHANPIAPPHGPVHTMPGFAHAYAQVNGTRIHYVIGGEGPAVVLLHGWPYTWALWRNLMPALASEGFTVIAPDLRGIGDSDRPDDGYSKVNVAMDIHALARELGFDSINLVGMDIGAMVAFAYAASFPDDVHRLVLAESVIPGFGLEELMNPATGGHWHFGFFQQVKTAAMLVSGHEPESSANSGRWAPPGNSRRQNAPNTCVTTPARRHSAAASSTTAPSSKTDAPTANSWTRPCRHLSSCSTATKVSRRPRSSTGHVWPLPT
jgi:pimeloyl-ACP methyl ester carboxylesterase